MQNIFMRTTLSSNKKPSHTTTFSNSPNPHSPIRLTNLSPQRYGKAAYDTNRTYTPSKLADNVLFRQLSSLKKVQEQHCKTRQLQSFNSVLVQRYNQLEQQKYGIQKTLTDQIVMYKRLLKEKQDKNQQRLKQIQFKFRQQINLLLEQKQEEILYFQSEKQIYQSKIAQLQLQLNQLTQKLGNQCEAFAEMKNQKEKKQIEIKNLQQSYIKMEDNMNRQVNKLESRIKEQIEQAKHMKEQHKQQLQKLSMNKQSQKLKLQQKLQSQIFRLQSQHHSLSSQSKQQQKQLNLQIQDLKQLIFQQKQTNKYLQQQSHKQFFSQLQTKQEIIINLSKQLQLVKGQSFEAIQKLQQQNIRASLLLKQMNQQNDQLEYEINQINKLFKQQKNNLFIVINQLKQQIKMNQLNYVNEKQKNQQIISENYQLMNGNEIQSRGKQILLLQINQLKRLLLQSSREIEICKEKYVMYERENKKMWYQSEKYKQENQNLMRMRLELQNQAVKWRQNYLRIAH